MQSRGVCAEECSRIPDIDTLVPEVRKLYDDFQRTIKNVTDSIEGRVMNRVVAHLRDGVNSLYLLSEKAEENRAVFSVIIRDLIKLLAPIAPHLCEESWSMLGFENLVSENPWPDCREDCLEVSVLNLPVQVNGKLRGTLSVGVDEDEEVILRKALELPTVRAAVGDGAPKKKIFVKGRVVNFVV
jgi:leucyl-tRNA synthetase